MSRMRCSTTGTCPRCLRSSGVGHDLRRCSPYGSSRKPEGEGDEVFNDGTKKELFCLDGTIPVSYKGNVYNIPVCVWLLDTHPYNSPMCYVKPTAYMQIKVSRHVDQTGRVFLPYLHEWNPNSSDLLGLIQVMIIVFGETPPVFSKPQEDSGSGFSAAGGAPYPTRPAAGGSSFMHMLGTAANPPYSSAAGPMPPYPTSASGPMGWSPYSTPLPSTTNTPAATSVAPTPAYPPYPTGSTASYPLYPTPGSGSGYPYPPASTASPVTQPATVGLPPNTGTITQEHIRASLLTAVEDKVKGRLKEVLSVAQAEMDVLKKTHDELNAGKTRLEDMINRMDREQAELESNLQTLRERNEEMKELVRKMESQGAVDVDEAVVTTAPLYKQLVNAFAEENATEDAIYYLGEALRKGVIDLDVFLKHVRELSRKQFMLRALMQKCREKAALP
ncbi:tumor susceptibility gene 101 protein isoform X3 [Ixodes scapularis]|uniref:tumor susceptibility gene 101 protein isoform X3 n=1 Tax=Ixodes scapularis TaxID=6945 RepID=UPI001A9E4E22|nr:tumor susceptibility gene 101 protein isoform X3 [Ixodes scapularis]